MAQYAITIHYSNIPTNLKCPCMVNQIYVFGILKRQIKWSLHNKGRVSILLLPLLVFDLCAKVFNILAIFNNPKTTCRILKAFPASNCCFSSLFRRVGQYTCNRLVTEWTGCLKLTWGTPVPSSWVLCWTRKDAKGFFPLLTIVNNLL